MAIGMGKMLGFHFDENFDYPYICVIHITKKQYIVCLTALTGCTVPSHSNENYNLIKLH